MERFQKFLEQQFNISRVEWETIEDHFEVISLSKNEYFINEGKICRRAAFILDGVVRYFGLTEDGNEQTCYFASENDYVLDPFSFPNQTPATFNVQLITDCTMAAITLTKDQALSQKYSKWPQISNALIQRAMAEFVNQKTMISYNAAQRYQHFVEKYPRYAQAVPIQYVASYLGIARPSLSRLRKQMLSK